MKHGESNEYPVDLGVTPMQDHLELKDRVVEQEERHVALLQMVIEMNDKMYDLEKWVRELRGQPSEAMGFKGIQNE